MPTRETVQVLNWTAERGFWFTHEERERETYSEEVARLVEELRAEGCESEPILHDRGECATCDALRRASTTRRPAVVRPRRQANATVNEEENEMSEENANPQGLAAKIATIQLEADIGKLPQRHVEVRKDGQIQYTYDYIEESTLMAHIRPLLAEKGVACFYGDEILSLNGNVATVRTSLTLVDGETGEERTMTTDGMAADKGDKMVNKAKTAAMRYLLWKWFLVPSSMDDPEVESIATSAQRPQSHVTLATPEAVESFLADMAAAGFDREAYVRDTLTPHQAEWEGVREDWLAGQRRDLQNAIAKKNTEA